MRIGIIGFGNFGSFIAEYFAKEHAVICVNKEDVVFSDNSVPFKFFRLDEISKLSAEALDVIVLAVSISSIEDVLKLCPPTIFQNKLVIDVLSVKVRKHRVVFVMILLCGVNIGLISLFCSRVPR